MSDMRMGDEVDVNDRCITDEIRVCAPLLHNLHFSRVGEQRAAGTLSLNCYCCAAGSGRRSAEMAHTPRLARVWLPRRRRHDVAAIAWELGAGKCIGKGKYEYVFTAVHRRLRTVAKDAKRRRREMGCGIVHSNSGVWCGDYRLILSEIEAERVTKM